MTLEEAKAQFTEPIVRDWDDLGSAVGESIRRATVYIKALEAHVAELEQRLHLPAGHDFTGQKPDSERVKNGCPVCGCHMFVMAANRIEFVCMDCDWQDRKAGRDAIERLKELEDKP